MPKEPAISIPEFLPWLMLHLRWKLFRAQFSFPFLYNHVILVIIHDDGHEFEPTCQTAHWSWQWQQLESQDLHNRCPDQVRGEQVSRSEVTGRCKKKKPKWIFCYFRQNVSHCTEENIDKCITLAQKVMNDWLETSSQAPSYASPKLCPLTHWLTHWRGWSVEILA